MKWTIAMSQKELDRKTVIEQTIDKRMTQKEGAVKLGISERHFRRLLFRYRQKGNLGLVSGSRGKPGNRRMKEEKRSQILEFIRRPLLYDFGPTLMAEKLAEYKKIVISKESMRQIMIEEGIHQPKRKKAKKIHPERERRARYGELVQIDGSYHAWLEERGPKACLLLFVDDATSAILAARFVDQESYFAYAALCKDYFRSNGVPVAFYSDRFSVFKVNSGEKEGITQFNRAITSLGMDLICANSPQAKGRVERANGTFQDRLTKELRLLGITNYQDANAYLPAFIKFYNQKFAVLPRSKNDDHSPLDKSIDLDFIFAIHSVRIISKDLQIRFNNVTYQIITNRFPQNLVKREVLVTLDEYGSVAAFLNGQQLTLQILAKQLKQIQEVTSKTTKPQVFIPPHNHPWRNYGKKLNGLPVLIND